MNLKFISSNRIVGFIFDSFKMIFVVLDFSMFFLKGIPVKIFYFLAISTLMLILKIPESFGFDDSILSHLYIESVEHPLQFDAYMTSIEPDFKDTFYKYYGKIESELLLKSDMVSDSCLRYKFLQWRLNCLQRDLSSELYIWLTSLSSYLQRGTSWCETIYGISSCEFSRVCTEANLNCANDALDRISQNMQTIQELLKFRD